MIQKFSKSNKPNFAPNLIDGHEKKDLLIRYLTLEATFLDNILATLRFQLKDVINVTSIWMMLRWNNKVAYIRQVQHYEFVLNLFELMAFENLATIIIIVIEYMLGK
jgi:hypothetical protein